MAASTQVLLLVATLTVVPLAATDSRNLRQGVLQADESKVKATEVQLSASQGRVQEVGGRDAAKVAKVVAASVVGLAQKKGSQDPVIDAETDKDVAEATEATKDAQSFFLLDMTDVAITLLVWTVVAVLCAIYHEKQKVYPSSSENKPEDLDGKFKFNLFGCFEEPMMTLLSCCCPAIRWADTSRMAGFMGFWVAFTLFFVLCLLNAIGGFAVFSMIIGVVGAFYRSKIRATFNMEQTAMTHAEDCLTYCCCTCCAIVQEARQLEEAYATNHEGIKDAKASLEKDT